MEDEFVIISDIHIAQSWDHIDGILPSELGFLNPNTVFKEFLASLKPHQKLIINGDLVDSYYANYQDDEKTNWELFYDLLKGCNNDYFLNAGNHDYRRSPSNLNFASLWHLNISSETLKEYAGRLGYGSFRFFGEWRSLQTVSPVLLAEQGLPSRYSKTIGNRRLLFFDTSKDILFSWSTLKLLTKLGKLSSQTPQLKGLRRAQINFLAVQLKEPSVKEIIIFVHAPPLFALHLIEPLRLSPNNYMRQLRDNELDKGIFVANNWKFMELLLKSDKNIIVISSHLHLNNEYLLDKDSLVLSQSNIGEINEVRQNERKIKLLTTLSLGALSAESRQIGYLTLDDREIKSIVTADYN